MCLFWLCLFLCTKSQLHKDWGYFFCCSQVSIGLAKEFTWVFLTILQKSPNFWPTQYFLGIWNWESEMVSVFISCLHWRQILQKLWEWISYQRTESKRSSSYQKSDTDPVVERQGETQAQREADTLLPPLVFVLLVFFFPYEISNSSHQSYLSLG